MHSGMHAAGYAIRGKDRSQRQSRSQGLGHGDDVGFYTVMLIGEIAAGTAQSALDFIEDQQSSGAIRQLPSGLQEFLAQRANSTFSLDGLQADGTYAAVELPLQVLCVVECDEADPWNQGREGMPVFLLSGGGQRTKSAAVERILQSQKTPLGFVTVAVLRSRESACELESAFPGFGTAVTEKGLLQTRNLGQSLS